MSDVTEHPLIKGTWLYRGVPLTKGEGVWAGQWITHLLKFDGHESRLKARSRRGLLTMIDKYREQHPEGDC